MDSLPRSSGHCLSHIVHAGLSSFLPLRSLCNSPLAFRNPRESCFLLGTARHPTLLLELTFWIFFSKFNCLVAGFAVGMQDYKCTLLHLALMWVPRLGARLVQQVVYPLSWVHHPVLVCFFCLTSPHGNFKFNLYTRKKISKN